MTLKAGKRLQTDRMYFPSLKVVLGTSASLLSLYRYAIEGYLDANLA